MREETKRAVLSAVAAVLWIIALVHSILVSTAIIDPDIGFVGTVLVGAAVTATVVRVMIRIDATVRKSYQAGYMAGKENDK